MGREKMQRSVVQNWLLLRCLNVWVCVCVSVCMRECVLGIG